MKKKFAAMFMAAAMVFTMAACGQKADTPSTPDADGSGDQSGTEVQTFVLGSCGPLTGSAAIYGQAVVNGAELAVEEINASDSTVKFTFLKQDDEADGEKALNAYNTMMDEGMQVLVGPTTTGASLTVSDQTNADRTFMLTPSASSPDVTKDKDNVFQVCFTDPNQGIASADYIADNGLATKIAIIYDSSDAYSKGIRDKFVEEAANKGLEIVTNEAFTADSKTDFSVQVQKAKDAGAELVFLPIYYAEANLIIQEMDKQGFDALIFGCDGLDGLLTIEGADLSLFEGVMLLTPFVADADDEATQAFVSKYQEKYGEIPNQFAADAYDGIYTILAAIEQSGATPDMDASTLCDALKAAMTEITVDGLTGEGMQWEATGEVNKAPRAMKIENGAYTAM